MTMNFRSTLCDTLIVLHVDFYQHLFVGIFKPTGWILGNVPAPVTQEYTNERKSVGV